MENQDKYEKDAEFCFKIFLLIYKLVKPTIYIDATCNALGYIISQQPDPEEAQKFLIDMLNKSCEHHKNCSSNSESQK